MTLHHFPPLGIKPLIRTCEEKYIRAGTHVLVWVLPVFHSHSLHKEISTERVLAVDSQLELMGFLQFDKKKKKKKSLPAWRHQTNSRPYLAEITLLFQYVFLWDCFCRKFVLASLSKELLDTYLVINWLPARSLRVPQSSKNGCEPQFLSCLLNHVNYRVTKKRPHYLTCFFPSSVFVTIKLLFDLNIKLLKIWWLIGMVVAQTYSLSYTRKEWTATWSQEFKTSLENIVRQPPPTPT